MSTFNNLAINIDLKRKKELANIVKNDKKTLQKAKSNSENF